MTVSKEKNFTERLLQMYPAKHCTWDKQAEHLFSVAEKSKETFSGRLYLTALHGTTHSI